AAACAEIVGIMTTMFDSTLEYVRNRQQFHVAIGSFQALQHRLADLFVELEQSKSHLQRCIATDAKSQAAAVAAAKSYISSAAIKLGEECIQLHGGMGVSEEVDIGYGHK